MFIITKTVTTLALALALSAGLAGGTALASNHDERGEYRHGERRDHHGYDRGHDRRDHHGRSGHGEREGRRAGRERHASQAAAAGIGQARVDAAAAIAAAQAAGFTRVSGLRWENGAWMLAVQDAANRAVTARVDGETGGVMPIIVIGGDYR